MATFTKNLNLYKTNMATDSNDTFSFDRDLNDNWDKIDEKIGEYDENLKNLNDGSATKDFDNLTDSAIDLIHSCTNGTYKPVDLSIKHQEEINSSYSGNVWAWIKARIQSANFSGINIGDYIPVELTGGKVGTYTIKKQTHKMQVAGIDTYYNWGDTPIPHHIDFISQDTLETCFTWNDDNTNNGTSAEQNSYKSSKLYAILNGVNNYSTSAQGSLKHGMDCSSGGILQMLPVECQNVLIQKRNWMEHQYNASKQVNFPSGFEWKDMGKLWLPHEVEVCGYQPNSYNRTNESGGNIDNLTRNMTRQYPLFMYNSRLKVGADTKVRSAYWLCTPSGASSTNVCNIAAYGNANHNTATNTFISACFGFRIG